MPVGTGRDARNGSGGYWVKESNIESWLRESLSGAGYSLQHIPNDCWNTLMVVKITDLGASLVSCGGVSWKPGRSNCQ